MTRKLTIGYADLPKDWEGPLFIAFTQWSLHSKTVRYRGAVEETVFDFYAPRFMLPGLAGEVPPPEIVVAIGRADGPWRTLGYRGAPMGPQTDQDVAEYRWFRDMVRSIRYKTSFEGKSYDLYVPKAFFKGESAPRRLFVQVDGIRFRLRFPIRDISRHANAHPDDGQTVEKIGAEVRRAGFYTKDQLLAMCDWMSGGPRARVQTNFPERVEEATRAALSARDERLRIGVLRLLDGVDWPTASVLLHFGHPDPYPILDVRTLWSLGLDDVPPRYSFEFWWAYVESCRQLVARSGRTIREVSRALWSYSKENQSP